MRQLFILIFLISFCACQHGNQVVAQQIDGLENDEAINYLQLKADTAAIFCQNNNLNAEFCILIDMKIHSGKNRFFVWDFTKNEIAHAGLCCHGMGGGSTGAMPIFSNVSGSYCTSLGKYKLGAHAYSQYGIHAHYKMHGLEATNSNAFKRIIVFHSHTPVPDYEIYPQHLPLGWSLGCPVVSDEMMTTVDAMLKASTSPVLLWIYY